MQNILRIAYLEIFGNCPVFAVLIPATLGIPIVLCLLRCTRLEDIEQMYAFWISFVLVPPWRKLKDKNDEKLIVSKIGNADKPRNCFDSKPIL